MTERRKAQRRLFLRLLLIVTLCFIWGNSLLTREESADVSRGLLELLSPLLDDLGMDTGDDLWLRKAAHFGEFCALGCELTLLFCLNTTLCLHSVCMAALCALMTAAIDETLQFLTGRAGMVQDVLRDFLGALVGMGLVLLIQIGRKNKHGKAGA